MGQTRRDSGDSGYVPSFELIPLDDEAEHDASLFDFGPDLGRPEGAPVAELPPWMQDRGSPTPGEEQGEDRRSRRRGQSLPRARRHRRPEAPVDAETTPAVPAASATPTAPAIEPEPRGQLFDEPVEAGSMDDTRDVDVTAVIAAEIAAERARKAAAGAGPEVPTQAPKRPERRAKAVPPVTILSAPAVPAQPAPAPTRPTRPVRSGTPSKPAPPAPPAVEARTTASATPAPKRNRYVAALLVAAAIGGGAAAWTLGGSATTEVVSDVALSGSALAARDWIAANLGDKSSVLAPNSVIASLKTTEFDPEKLVPYPVAGVGGQMPDWRCCNVLVATAASGADAREALPSTLRNSFDRSRLMATFTGGGTVTEVRQVLDGTPEAVAAALKAEKKERIAAGKEIVEIDAIKLSKTAKAALVAGDVDTRVMLALVGMSRQVEVRVLDFISDAADRAADSPARGVRLDRLGGKTIEEGGEAPSKAFDFLDAQVDPYRPLDVTFDAAEGGAEGSIMRVVYDAPGTLGLIRPRD